MKVTSLEFTDGVLTVDCTGEFGVGSMGQASADLVGSLIGRWIASNPDRTITRIDIDYSDVDYSWGDGPVSSMVAFFKQGVPTMRVIASSKNVESLKGLVENSNIHFIEVVHESVS